MKAMTVSPNYWRICSEFPVDAGHQTDAVVRACGTPKTVWVWKPKITKRRNHHDRPLRHSS